MTAQPVAWIAWRERALWLVDALLDAWGEYADSATNSMEAVRKKNAAFDAWLAHLNTVPVTLLTQSQRATAHRLSAEFDRGTYLSHDIIDAATLLGMLANVSKHEQGAA